MNRAITLVTLLFVFSCLGVAQNQQVQDDVRIVRGPEVNASDHSAEISWGTNNVAATFVKYGKDRNNLDKESQHSGGARDHRVVLAELEPGTTYHYQILTEDGKVRNEGQFTTKGAQAAGQQQEQQQQEQQQQQQTGIGGPVEDDVRIEEGPVVQSLSANSATLFWRTNNVAANHVRYGTDPNRLDQTAYEPGGSREHRLELTNLQPGREYYFEILTNDQKVRTSGQFTTPQTGQAATPGSQFPSVPTQPGQTGQQQGQVAEGPRVEFVGDTTARITWRTNERSSSVVRYGTEPNSLNQVAIGPWGERHEVELRNLRPNTTYHFRVESSATGRSGPQSQTATGQFQTVAQGQQGIGQPQ